MSEEKDREINQVVIEWRNNGVQVNIQSWKKDEDGDPCGPIRQSTYVFNDFQGAVAFIQDVMKKEWPDPTTGDWWDNASAKPSEVAPPPLLTASGSSAF